METRPRRRPHSYPLARSESWEPELVDYVTANDVFPVKVPLERVEIGSWRYTATELDDIELLYELESSDLLIKTGICGTNGAVPATFRVRDVSAADLSLVNVVPGSLESMVARLVLETNSKVVYNVDPLLRSNEKTTAANSETSGDQENSFDCNVVTMSASVHESGHLRDILVFLKCGYTEECSSGNLFLRPQKQKSQEPCKNVTTQSKNRVTFLESLPFWVLYIPWWLYSRRVRTMIQAAIFIYSIFSVIWASWQLYRHVNVIHDTLEPMIKALRVYLSSVMETFDAALALFTVWWTTFLSPLNIFRGMLLAPLFQVALQLKVALVPIANVLSSIFVPIWRFVTNSSLLSSLKASVLALYQLVLIAGQFFWTILRILAWPLKLIWQSILNSQIAVSSLDLKRVRLSWVFGLVTNSLRAIGNGLAKLVGYTRMKQKQHKALKNPTPITPSKSPRPNFRAQRPPVLYSSPLTKQN